MKGSLGRLWVVSIPMRTPFRGITEREALIFRGERFAEWSPFTEYQDLEAATWLKGAMSWANDPLPAIRREVVGINATLPAVKPDAVAEVLSRFEPFNTVKIKVAQKGEALSDDLARIRTVASLYPKAKLRLDANGGYDIDGALELISSLQDFNIEYLEQPVNTVEELAALRKIIGPLGLKIAADESIRKSSDPEAVARLQAADIVMLKAQPLGGISESLRIASETGAQSVVSSALETSLGIAQGLYLAAALPELEYDCGLGTVELLAGDIVTHSLKPKNSELKVSIPEADPALLERYAASPDRTKWWLERLERCMELLD